jgi:hypothetical protein
MMSCHLSRLNFRSPCYPILRQFDSYDPCYLSCHDDRCVYSCLEDLSHDVRPDGPFADGPCHLGDYLILDIYRIARKKNAGFV